jgi:hypothetical protein
MTVLFWTNAGMGIVDDKGSGPQGVDGQGTTLSNL